MPSENADELDKEQEEIVNATASALAVYAGPGSGKTRTLVHRAAALLRRDTGSSALLLTFTNKAAAEMKRRSVSVATTSLDRIMSYNFHAFGHHLLLAHGSDVGIHADFEVIDGEEQLSLAAEVASRASFGNRLELWRKARLKRLEPDRHTAAFGAAFEAKKRSLGVVDFDDLVVYSELLLRTRPEVASAYATHFRHVLVDEFQDTNPAQLSIVESLATEAATITVFADDDQAIFAFQHAESANLRRFLHDTGAEPVSLSRNHRSARAIVECANRLIACDPGSSGRRMTPVREGGLVRWHVSESAAREAEAIAAEIATAVALGEDPASIAVIARLRLRLDCVVEALRRVRVAVTDWRGDAFGPDERRAVSSVLAVIRGTVRDSHARRLARFANLSEVPEPRSSEAFLTACGGGAFVDSLRQIRSSAHGGAGSVEIVDLAVCALAATVPSLELGLREIARHVRLFQDSDPAFSLDHLLADLAIGSGGRGPETGGGVRVATIHGTKGLEWRRVYVVGLEEGTLPDYHAASEAEISDERRLFFVGICRCREELTVSRVERSAEGWSRERSRFWDEARVGARA
jgi:superfamily I DNA/RNA helicase